MDYDTGSQNRLKRIEGQIRGISRMMSEGNECKNVVSQLSAARITIDRTSAIDNIYPNRY